MTRLELARFANRNVVLTLANGTVLGGYFDDEENGSIAFWGLPAHPTVTSLVRMKGPRNIPYEWVEHVKVAR